MCFVSRQPNHRLFAPIISSSLSLTSVTWSWSARGSGAPGSSAISTAPALTLGPSYEVLPTFWPFCLLPRPFGGIVVRGLFTQENLQNEGKQSVRWLEFGNDAKCICKKYRLRSAFDLIARIFFVSHNVFKKPSFSGLSKVGFKIQDNSIQYNTSLL